MDLKDFKERKLIVAMVLLGVLSAGIFLIASSLKYSLGFPLDDAWIHQTYARNLGELGEWSFMPGQSSAGSTSPLWSALIAVGYFVKIPYTSWTYGLGVITLIATGWFAVDWFSTVEDPAHGWKLGLAALFFLEWHLVWAALSGMETILLAFLSVFVLWLLSRKDIRYFGIGLLIGLGVWVRPDALILLLPVGWDILIRYRANVTKIGTTLLRVLAGISGPFLVYLYMNWILVGSVWPSTFYAKQIEYAVLRQTSLIVRYFGQLGAISAGILVLLLPGIVLYVIQSVTSRSLERLAALIWAGAYLGAYAFRLPATYQHGRYAIPTIPVLLVLGLAGFWGWYTESKGTRNSRVISRVWFLSLGIVGGVFWWRGSQAYAQDVAIIQTEMVKTSLWIAEHTESDSSIAAHDIGALGFFGERAIIDLAGLVTPEVIPFIRSEEAIESFLNQNSTDYLMTFPGWYPRLIQGLPLVYMTNSTFSPQSGGENMAVYRWR